MRERVLGRCGMRVSELCLGTMTFGTSWQWGGSADETTARQIYAAYRAAGGNFVDTANMYTEGESEQIVGRLIADERDAVVVATKFTLPTDRSDHNTGGSHRKSLRRSLEASLRRLGSDYIDLLWVHAWDRCTPAEETLRALDDAIRVGKILAIGVSNTPAWVVARSQTVAELRGWSTLAGIQVEYSLVARTAERELIPMAEDLGLSILAWSPLARGLLAGKSHRSDGTALTPDQQRALDEAGAVAVEVDTTIPEVALAWVLHRGVIPVLGASRLSHVRENLAACEIELSAGQLARLDDATRVPLGYPHEFLRDRAPALLERPDQR
jgi:aryl-alcohol dehydrogenase-like predicted oxidoreductase